MRRDYFRDQFASGELRDVLNRIGISSREVLSTRSRAYQSRRDEIDSLSDDDVLEAMVAEPTLIRRPLIVSDTSFVIGSKIADLEQFATSLASRKG